MNPANHILAAFDGPTITKEVQDLILKHNILGFTLFKWNIESAEQLTELNKELQSLAKQAGYQLILAVDHEGGRVFRLPEPFSTILPMREWGKIFDQSGDVEPFFELGKILATEIKAAGFNLNFAPVVDVDSNAQNPIIGDRSFSSSPDVVYKLCRQVIRGMIKECIIPCLKHFPSHGATHQDSHEELPIDERSLDEIQNTDIPVYQKLIAEQLAPTIMTAHVVYPKIDSENPATLSPKILNDILRKQLNYNGIIFSDDLLMKAIADNYKIEEAAKTFFDCGGDIALICKDPLLTLEVIQKLNSNHQDLKPILDQSTKRIAHLKNTFLKTPIQTANLEQTLQKNKQYLQNLFNYMV